MHEVHVFLTVDVECSIGGAFADAALKPVGSEKRIFGRLHDREYGISLMMDIAERYGLSLVFFVETFQERYFGPMETRKVVHTILRRNHDVQLHLHPNYLNFDLERPQDLKFSDLCGDYPLDAQVQMISEAARMLERGGAPKPLAFRAGCFGADVKTLRALKINGLLIDSSYNQAYVGTTCKLPNWAVNDVTEQEGIFEFPVTQFVESSGLRPLRSMPLDINGVSFEEIKYVLNAARNGTGPRNITVLLHSFSFLKPYDVQYRRMRPRWNVIRRFDKLCRFLAANASSFRVRTFRELSRKELEHAVGNARHNRPQVPPPITWRRLAEQAMDRWL